MKKSKGISLIVLVITILVIIILAGAVILNFTLNNPIISANEAVFKSDISNIKEEIEIYTMKNIQNDGTFRYPSKAEIKSADRYDSTVLNIFNGNIIYKTSDLEYKDWVEELGIVADYTNSLIYHYKMDGNAKDSISNGSGIIYGAAVSTLDRFGKLSSALEFGNSGYNYILANATQNNTNVTVCAWIFPKKYPTERSTIVVGTNSTSNSYYLSLYSNGALNSYWYGTNPAGYHTTVAGVIPLNKWSFVCTSWDGSYNRLYVNGSLLKTSISTGIGIETMGFNIGAENPTRQFYGSIDDVRIYSRVLSETEISNLYKYIYWDN